MNEDSNGNKLINKLNNGVKSVLKVFLGKKRLIIILAIIILIVIITGSFILIKKDHAKYKEGDMSSTPYANSQYQSNITISENGEINTSKSAQEIWDEMIKAGSAVNKYLNNATELKKLMNAQNVTQYVDTRANPDEKIDWNKLLGNDEESESNSDSDSEDEFKSDFEDPNSTKVQGIIKLKRADINGNITTLTYVSPETMQGYIDEYNNTGSETVKNEASKHFTLEKSYSSSSAYYGTSSGLISGGTIEAGTVFEVNPEYGVGHVYTYESWQGVGNNPSAPYQYNLVQQAGRNFNEEGFRSNQWTLCSCRSTGIWINRRLFRYYF